MQNDLKATKDDPMIEDLQLIRGLAVGFEAHGDPMVVALGRNIRGKLTSLIRRRKDENDAAAALYYGEYDGDGI